MSNPVTVSGVTLRFGDPNYPATAPEKYMYFKETGTGTYDAIYSTDGTTEDTSYYPDILALYISGSVTSITGSGMIFVTYDAAGTPTESETTTVNSGGFYTIKPQSDNSTITVNGNVTVNFSAPNVQIAEGSKPAAVTGYPARRSVCPPQQLWLGHAVHRQHQYQVDQQHDEVPGRLCFHRRLPRHGRRLHPVRHGQPSHHERCEQSPTH